MKKLITLILSATLFTFVANATFYVVSGGAGTQDGSSWGNAYGNIQTAVDAASVLVGSSGEAQDVWVKTGTYSTSVAALIMKEKVNLYGGFAGTETALSQRAKGVNPWAYTNVTTLNGGATKRCIEVAANFTTVTVIDGFTITNGNGQGVQLTNSGGGVLLRNNLKLENCIVTGNTTSGNGGGVNATGGIVTNCWVYNNTTTSATIPSAGGIYSNANFSGGVAMIEGCLIERNSGGGVRLQGALANDTIKNCIIRNNSSTGAGAAIYTNNPASCIIINSVITNNSGNNVIYLNRGKLINSTVANNEGVIYLASAANIGELYNNIIVNNVAKGTSTPTSVGVVASYPVGYVKNNAAWPSVAYQSWGGGTDSLLTTDVETAKSQVAFKSPTSFIGTTTDAGLLTEISDADWSLSYNSLCLNFGDNTLITSGVTTDFAGNARIVSTAVDAGAYEFSPYFNTTVTFNTGGTVSYNAGGLTSGVVLAEPKGKPLAFTITPTSGQQIASVKYNNVEVKEELVEGVYTAPALAADATLLVEFSPTTAVNDIKNTFVCFASRNAVELRGVTTGDQISVYAITGTRLFSAKAVNSELSVPVERGIYLVKVADMVKKIVVD